MGKSKKKGSTATAAAPRCNCDHPFTCMCGNRPERPSRGHKWYPEDQVWAGKGHKQKGASGQTALVAQTAIKTAKGNTAVEQWQRLPSQLLAELCKTQKRPPPRFKNIEKGSGVYKYRVIVADQKDKDRDMFFVPAHAVPNEEQAKEEGALVALLELTPNIPHERKLPEPYKTTWLNAIKSRKEARAAASKPRGPVPPKQGGPTAPIKSSSPNRPTPSANKPASSSNKAAFASMNLVSSHCGGGVGSGLSQAERRKVQAEKRRLRNERIRYHDNIRLANQNHPVFMSSTIRKMIETLLRGGKNGGDALKHSDTDDDEEEDALERDDLAGENNAQAYIVHRLFQEGFTKRQARTAYRESAQARDTLVNVDDDDLWDSQYEECLQWLLIHLNEDQLPVGFDPRESTLAVVVPKTGADPSGASRNSLQTERGDMAGAVEFATRFGITEKEAAGVMADAKKNNSTSEMSFWRMIQASAGIEGTHTPASGKTSSDKKTEEAINELEALEAIYGSECTVEQNKEGLCTIKVALEEGTMTLSVIVQNGLYPSSHPISVLVSGKWPAKTGSTVHVELAKFVNALPYEEPMIFAIHAHVQDILFNGDLPTHTLLAGTNVKKQYVPTKEDNGSKKETQQQTQKSTNDKPTLRRLRPKQHRNTFWSTKPKDTPEALACPKVCMSMQRTRSALPAANSKKEFLEAMKRAEKGGRVLLVTGETGSGKSTQLPAFLLENDPSGAKIVVAQPRRLAATGVATRVAEERGESKAGVDSVGYVVRGDSAISNRSRLVFCTTGVLLRQMQNDGALDCVTHIVVDEVHERSLDSDVLLGLLKQNLSMFPHLRVILMSATLDTTRFQKYWGPKTPHVHLPGRTFPVTDFFLEDILRLTGYTPPKKKKKGGNRFSGHSHGPSRKTAWNDSEVSDTEEGPEEVKAVLPSAKPKAYLHDLPIEDLVKRVDETSPDADLICRLVQYLIRNTNECDGASILIFLAGAPEINIVMETIKRGTRDLPVILLPLHGGLQPRDQNRVFQSASKGFTKVILSTNVAETSITIPDCTVVIDTGREKQSSYDPANRMPLLLEQFASKASMKQRRGRAGRVQEGTCYKIISRSTFESLSDHSAPEIRRVALDQTLLQLVFLGVEKGSGTFMNTLLDPPKKEALEAAALNLLKLGAVERKDSQEEIFLTPLGAHLAGIPAPPIVGKMLVMGSLLGCREAALAMAAGISVGRSPVLRLDSQRRRDSEEQKSMEEMKNERIVQERAAYTRAVGNSDHAFLASICLKWKAIGVGAGHRKRFCDSLGLSFNGMRDMAQLANQLDSALVNAGFSPTQESNSNSNSWRIIHACAVAAMAPGQVVRVRRPATKYHETAEGAKEKDGEARELKFFIRTGDGMGESSRDQEERVFIHPSSTNFSNGNYSCPFLVYNSMVRTSKPFLRDVTECSAYALLLFGGKLDIKASEGVVVVGGWAELSANARIGSLMGGLRSRVDDLLTEKVKNPTYQIADTEEMRIIVKLIRTDGLGS